MPGFGGAVIPMKDKLTYFLGDDTVLKDKLTYFLGNDTVLKEIKNQPPFPIFAEDTLEFLREIARQIRNRKEKTSDLAAFGFWCGRINATIQKTATYEKTVNIEETVTIQEKRMGRGVSLHFAASNMPMLFAYSMAAALLAGNCVIMRLSDRETEQEQILLEILKQIMDKHPMWKKRMVLLRYEHNSRMNNYLSALCDVRIIWGRDSTVEELKKSPLTEGAVDVTFTDRGSAAVFDAESILRREDLYVDVMGFYNDTYAYDQNACSSPSIIYWIGEEKKVVCAKRRFWNEMETFLKERYLLPEVLAVKKWENALAMAASIPQVKILHQDNRIIRIELPKLTEQCWDYRTAGGFFMEASGENLQGLLPILTDKCQTITVLGYEKEKVASLGALRVTENGHALDFSLEWDGVDLISAMSQNNNGKRNN